MYADRDAKTNHPYAAKRWAGNEQQNHKGAIKMRYQVSGSYKITFGKTIIADSEADTQKKAAELEVADIDDIEIIDWGDIDIDDVVAVINRDLDLNGTEM